MNEERWFDNFFIYISCYLLKNSEKSKFFENKILVIY